MGLLDELVGAAGQAGGQGEGEAAAGGQGSAVGAILGMIQNHPGGVGGLLSAFQQGGLGAVAQSWLQPGENQPVSPGQVQDALGPGPVADVAQRMGVSNGEAAGSLSQLLPQIMDHLSPGGQVPTDGGSGMIGGLLSRLGAR